MNASHTLMSDHVRLSDVYVSRAYFSVLRSALRHLPNALDAEIEAGKLDTADAPILSRHLSNLEASIFALSKKYLMSGKLEGALREELTIDVENSGFPVAHELYVMAADAANAAQDLALLPDENKIKAQMLREILTQSKFPVALQNMMAKRQYAKILSTPGLFLPRTNPVASQGVTQGAANERVRWRVDWAVYDTTMNVPVIYILDLEDSGRYSMPDDTSVWPVLCHHLLSQSINTLSLKTIAEGVDRDFRTLHPLRLRRLVIGPFYANTFTHQEGAVDVALDKAGDDSWVLAVTTESLDTKSTRVEGLFSRTEMQVFHDAKTHQVMLTPSRVFQSIQDHARSNFDGAHKYVIDDKGNLVSRR